MCSYFIRHFSPLGIAQASFALLSLIEKVRSFGVFLVIFSHFARHLAPLNSSQNRTFSLRESKANLFVLPNAEKWREAKNMTQKYISKYFKVLT